MKQQSNEPKQVHWCIPVIDSIGSLTFLNDKCTLYWCRSDHILCEINTEKTFPFAYNFATINIYTEETNSLVYLPAVSGDPAERKMLLVTTVFCTLFDLCVCVFYLWTRTRDRCFHGRPIVVKVQVSACCCLTDISADWWRNHKLIMLREQVHLYPCQTFTLHDWLTD